MSDTYVLFCDGASRGNPGPASAGGLWLDGQGTVVLEFSRALGRATNNVAEYRSLILGLEGLRDYLSAESSGRSIAGTSILVKMDSELVVRQIQGRYQVKNAALKPLYQTARALLDGFGAWQIAHVPRAENARADRLANRALDEADRR